MPKLIDVKPKIGLMIDIKPKVGSEIDIKPKIGELRDRTRSYSVAHTAGVIMLSIPLITYPTAGTETQWSDSGGT